MFSCNTLWICQVERPSLLIENLKKQMQHQAYSDLDKRSQTFQNADSEMEDLSQQGKC